MTLAEALEALFTEDEIDAQAAPELEGYRMGFTGEHGQVLVFAKADPERRAATFYAIAPFSVSEERSEATMRFVTRANFGLPVGCFELDLEDGELRFRVTVPYGELAPSAELFRPALWAAVAGLDTYLPGLVAVSQQGLDDEAALALVEG